MAGRDAVRTISVRIAEDLLPFLSDRPEHGLAEAVLQLLAGGWSHVLSLTEGIDGCVQIAGVARTGIAQHEVTHHVFIDAGNSGGHGGRIGQNVAHRSRAEGLAFLARGAHLRGEGVGHGIAVLLTHGGKKHVASMAVGTLERKKGTDLASAFKTAVLDDDVHIVSQRICQLRKIAECKTDVCHGHASGVSLVQDCTE